MDDTHVRGQDVARGLNKTINAKLQYLLQELNSVTTAW